MNKICLMLLLILSSCSPQKYANEYIEADSDEKDYWQRIEECGFKFREPEVKCVEESDLDE